MHFKIFVQRKQVFIEFNIEHVLRYMFDLLYFICGFRNR